MRSANRRNGMSSLTIDDVWATPGHPPRARDYRRAIGRCRSAVRRETPQRQRGAADLARIADRFGRHMLVEFGDKAVQQRSLARLGFPVGQVLVHTALSGADDCRLLCLDRARHVALPLGRKRVVSPRQPGKRFPPISRTAPRTAGVSGDGEMLESFPRFGDDVGVGCCRQSVGERWQTHRTFCEPR